MKDGSPIKHNLIFEIFKKKHYPNLIFDFQAALPYVVNFPENNSDPPPIELKADYTRW